MDQLQTLVLDRSPNEAVGLLLDDDTILELPNRSHSPQDSFSFLPSDIEVAIEVAHVDPYSIDWDYATLWHSHPSGGVGPSRTDIHNKLPKVNHLVLTIQGDGVLPTWY